MRNIFIFDLDMTVIDSSHRTPNKPDGTLNLVKYLSLKTRPRIFADKLLPLANFMKKVINSDNYTIVATARILSDDDLDFLREHEIMPHKILSRDTDYDMTLGDGYMKAYKLARLLSLKQFASKPKYMFEDSPTVLRAMRKRGIVVLNANHINRRLAYGH
jgi:hypothetical protein